MKNVFNKEEVLLPDMESDGVYFPEHIKMELQNQRIELICEYSGLPSLLAYLDN
jgi:hypothetical protein